MSQEARAIDKTSLDCADNTGGLEPPVELGPKPTVDRRGDVSLDS
jgi:hypothetical protein